MKSIILTRKSKKTIIQAVAEDVPKGAPKALWNSLRAVTRDEQRSDLKRIRGCRSATREDFAVVAELRLDVPPAYEAADLGRRKKMPAIRAILRYGDMAQASEATGEPISNLRRWMIEGPESFLGFAAVYLSAKVKKARNRLARGRAEFESKVDVARAQCREICNREDRHGSWYESAGRGCEACPLRVLNQAAFARTEEDGLIASRVAEIERETEAWAKMNQQKRKDRVVEPSIP